MDNRPNVPVVYSTESGTQARDCRRGLGRDRIELSHGLAVGKAVDEV